MTAATLSSPNSWLFERDDLDHTPSRADGLTYEREIYERASGVDLIVRVGAVRVDVPLLTVATASVFLHRFYMLESLKKFPVRETAMACLFLAGKVEESLRKVETVVNYCLRLEDRRRGKEPDVHPSSDTFKRLVQQVLYTEEVILVALQFDLNVVHPHPILTRALKSLEPTLKHQERLSLGRCAWQVLSDIYTLPLCICHEPETLAAAAFLLSWSILADIFPALPHDWTKEFDIDWQDREDVQEVDTVIEGVLQLWEKARKDEIRAHAGAVRQRLLRAIDFMQEAQSLPPPEAPIQESLTAIAENMPKESTESVEASPLAPAPVQQEQDQKVQDRPGEAADAMQVDAESPIKEYEQPPTPG